MIKLTKSIFIDRASKIHGNKYDYNKVIYKHTKIKVEIICNKHGSFWQTPGSHLYLKQGCPKCGVMHNTSKRTKSLNDFINSSIKIHGDIYDYSLVEYKNYHSSVIISCKIHGNFNKTPASHLKGSGCKKCAIKKLSDKMLSTNSDFIKKARLLGLDDKYDYTHINYTGNKNKIKILCKKCNKYFNQIPSNHLRGHGCRHCFKVNMTKHSTANPTGWSPSNWSKAAKKSKSFDSFKVYVIKCHNDYETFYKIGRTFNKVSKRFKTKSLMPYKYEVVSEFIFNNPKEAFDYENKMKSFNSQYIYNPKTKFQGFTECFTQVLSPDAVIVRR